MIDLHQLIDWILVVVVLVALPLVSKRHLSEGSSGGLLRRFGGWAVERARLVPVVDEATADLWRVLRRERLAAHLQRVRRLIASDTWMSATRQLGNRLAYDQLMHELDELRDVALPLSYESAVDHWDEGAVTVQLAPLSSYRSERPQVEVLEIGWRR